jgi:hypothetical protein
MSRAETEIAQALVVNAFARLLADALRDPRMARRVEDLAAAVAVLVAVHAAQPVAEVITLSTR